MEHFYKNITGWTTFFRFYKDMVAKFPNGSKFVECGTYSGQSFAYLMVEMVNQKKVFDVTAIDSYTFTDEKTGENILDAFRRNLKPFEGKYKVIKDISWESADCFEDNSIDFLFLDADHIRASFEKDLEAWIPKMAPNSIISGHDVCIEPYWPNDHPDVLAVINEVFGEDGWDRSYVDEKVWYKQL